MCTTASPGIATLYLDGELLASAPTNTSGSLSQGTLIGAYSDNGTDQHHFLGDLDDFRIYERALSEAEVETLHNECLVTTVAIDIKPGSDPNCFNLNGHGVIPVAILGSAELDVDDVKTDDTLSFNGLDVRVRAKKEAQCSFEYSNDDAYLDLVCHFLDDPDQWTAGTENQATLTGELIDGTPIEGTDAICIVP